MIMVIIMIIIMILIIITIIIMIKIMKVKKIKMMLISFILLRPSSSNKVKILLLDRSFISKDLILTYLFTRPGSFK